jgi:hypothetical protein
VKDMGRVSRVLNLQVEFSDAGISISQQAYTHSLFPVFGMEDCKAVSTPIATAPFVQNSSQLPFSDATKYRSAVGKLMYAMIGTRPDIAFAVGAVSRHMAAPTQQHWVAVKRIFRYLKGTEAAKILYKWGTSSELTVHGYCDSDWAADLNDRKSTAGYVFLLSGGPVTWSSKKQATVALSTTEAEYMAAAMATKEAVWLRRLLSNLGHPQTRPTTIFEDNRGCIEISKNPVNHARTKHIDIRHHFVRERTLSGEIRLVYCSTEKMLADLLTKPLPRPRFESLLYLLMQR